jgi:hypothetical protein
MRYELMCESDDGSVTSFMFESDTLHEVLGNFKHFLMANGFVIDPYSSLVFVNEEVDFPIYSTGE